MWYAEDFGDGPTDRVAFVEQYVPPEAREAIRTMLNGPGRVEVRVEHIRLTPRVESAPG